MNEVEASFLDFMKLTQVLSEGGTLFLAEPFFVLGPAPKSSPCKSTEKGKQTSHNNNDNFHG